MAYTNAPKTARINIQGADLTINQNGRVLNDVGASRLAYMIKTGQIRVDNGMLFVGLDDIARAFGLKAP